MKALVECCIVHSFLLSIGAGSLCLSFGSCFHPPIARQGYQSTTASSNCQCSSSTDRGPIVKRGKGRVAGHTAHSIHSAQPPSLMFASRNADDAYTNAAPMYITIGPQCCGKSTFLKKQHPHVLDISLDDQLDVYIPIHTSTFLTANSNNTSTGDDMKCLDNVHHGKTLRDRIQHDKTELTLILRYWNGDLSAQDFAIHLLQFYQKKEQPVKVAQYLVRAIQETKYQMPDQVQVFVVESLFRPHPTDNLSAIQRAYKLLRTTPSHIPVAWGNTNSKPRDYQMALEIACQTRRPVHICLSSPDGPLPSLPLSELFVRNLQRFSKSGKYVPAMAIAECWQRVNALVAQTKDMDPLSKEQYLVELAEPPHNRNHNNNNNATTSTYRYRLTRNRLIQKEMLESPIPSSTTNQEREGTSSRSSAQARPTPPSQYPNSRKRPNDPFSSYSQWNPQQQQRNGNKNFENDSQEPTDPKRPRTNHNANHSNLNASSQDRNTTRTSQSRGRNY